MLSVIDTELWLSAVVETEVTVGAVVSVVDALSEDAVVVVDAPSSLLLLQEMTVKLKRDMRIMDKTLFIFFLHR
jgi:predicted nucleic acid-binding protein